MTDAVEIPARADEILRRRPIGYVSTLRPDGHMSVVPVAVIYDGEAVRITSLKRRVKVASLRLDPRITVCVPDPENLQRYVEIRGVAEIADDTDRAFVNTMAKEWMGLDEYPFDPGEDFVIITVVPEVISCPKVHGAD